MFMLSRLVARQCGWESYCLTCFIYSWMWLVFSMTIKNCMKLLENTVFHDKLKHIDIKLHYLMDMVQRVAVNLH